MNPLERQRLIRSHQELDEEIQRTLKQPLGDPMTLQRLKKQKLAIKDRLHRIVDAQPDVKRSDQGAGRTPLHAA